MDEVKCPRHRQTLVDGVCSECGWSPEQKTECVKIEDVPIATSKKKSKPRK